MYYRIIIALIFLVCLSCCNESNKSIFSINKTDIYIADSTNSVISWTRFADNKLINKKVKLFDSYVDIKMDNVTFNTSGTTPLKSGKLIYINDVFSSGKIEMNFSVCRFYSEEEESFFKVKDFPPAVLIIDGIYSDSINNKEKLNVDATLTIRDSIKKITFPASLEKDSLNNLIFSGEYIMQTLDWPIRENPDRNNIRKDEITFKFNILFSLNNTLRDTVFNN